MKISRNWKAAVILLLSPVLFAIPGTAFSKEANQRGFEDESPEK
jgi:hypothetical protein